MDNTFCTAVVFNPFEVGADVVVESCTKYLSGKSDAVAGVAITRKGMSNKIADNLMYDALQEWRMSFGACASPFNAWAVTKGLETLHLRMSAVRSTAMEVPSLIACYAWVMPPWQCNSQVYGGGRVYL